MSDLHPDLVWAARLLPRSIVGPRTLGPLRALGRLAGPPRSAPGVSASQVDVPGGGTARVFASTAAAAPRPAVLWIHGGGFVIGSPAQDDPLTTRLARELGAVVVAPTYRLAPEHPFPAALDDLYAALTWIHEHADALGVRRDRVAVAGASAGGGLAAGLTLRARDRSGPPVAFQLLVYPMLDDRTVGRPVDGRHHRLWSADDNRFGWTSYLGREPGGSEVPVQAAPARAGSLAGLPPTWIGVGTLDLFHDEDLAYAQRLEAAGVAVARDVVPGAFHGFDAVPRAAVSRAFRDRLIAALRGALA